MVSPAEAASAADMGAPSARKSGRDSRWPYVPVVLYTGELRPREEQILGRAFATRSEAEGYAARTIDRRRLHLLRQLEQPRYRALRAQHGVDA